MLSIDPVASPVHDMPCNLSRQLKENKRTKPTDCSAALSGIPCLPRRPRKQTETAVQCDNAR